MTVLELNLCTTELDKSMLQGSWQEHSGQWTWHTVEA